MNKAIKILILTAGAAAFAGTGYAAWTVAVTDGVAESRVVNPDVTGDVSLSAAGVSVATIDDSVLLSPTDISNLSFSYRVTPQQADWYEKADQLDTTQKVNLKITTLVESTNGGFGTYLNLPAAEQILAPTVWLASNTGYVAEFAFSWKFDGTPEENAIATIPTAESRKDYLDGIYNTIVGLSITVTFDLVSVNP